MDSLSTVLLFISTPVGDGSFVNDRFNTLKDMVTICVIFTITLKPMNIIVVHSELKG